MFILIPPPTDPGIQDKNSNPDIEFSVAKFDSFLSKTEDPAIIVFLSTKDNLPKGTPNLIITPSNPPSLIKVFQPAPITVIFCDLSILVKNIERSLRDSGLNITFAGPPKLNQESFERFSFK